MREIKFREYRGDGKWHYWGLFEQGKFTGPCSPNSKADQFTGYQDSKGNDIYESDIIRFYLPDDGGTEDGIVKFIDGGWCTQSGICEPSWLFEELTAGFNAEIVGNTQESRQLTRVIENYKP